MSPKKRKLNSKNPKYYKDNKTKKKYKRVLMREGKDYRMFFLYEIKDND